MTFTRRENLAEDFNNHDGSLIGYMDRTGAGIDPRYHYDLRSFHNDDITVPQTMLDMNYWNSTYFDGIQMVVLDNERIVTGRSIAARYISEIDQMTLGELNSLFMNDLDLSTLVAGNENWPVGDSDVVYGKDSAERYANSMQITLASGIEKIVSSDYRDNILANLDDAGHDYFVELALPSFPAQAAPTHIDLDLSRIEFSTDPGFAGPKTDSFRFGDSLNDLTAGGDTYFQINRNQFVNADLSALRYIRFKLTATGNMTLKMQAMRVVRDDYTWDLIDTESKRGVLARSVPRDSGTEPSTVSMGADDVLLSMVTRPKDIQLTARFNSGHNPVGDDNILRLYGRYDIDQDDAIFVELKARNTQSRLSIYQRLGGVDTLIVATPTLSNILTEEENYILILEIQGDQTRAVLHKAAGAFFGEEIYSTDWFGIDLVDRGYTGFYFLPYNYDFTLSYLQNHGPSFAFYESTPFVSHLQVVGATLSVNTSAEYDLATNSFTPAGDAIVVDDPNFGIVAPSKKFVRDGSDWQGGYQTSSFIYIGNTKYLTIEGDIYPVRPTSSSTLRGEWRVVLLDRYDSVAYIGKIRGLLPNQWNHFKIHVNNEKILPASYRVIVQQIGFYDDTFWIDNLAVNHQTVTWEISPDGGGTWYKFLTAQNKQYASVNFKEFPGTNIKLRGRGLSDLSWINELELAPIYGQPGQYTPPPLPTYDTERTQDIRLEGTGQQSLVDRDTRITGELPSIVTRDARITGVATSSSTQDVRITGLLVDTGISLPLLFND